MIEHVSPHGYKALVTVAEWLEAGAPHKQITEDLAVSNFDMSQVVSVDPTCGTSCCIAGAVCQFAGLGLAVRDEDGDLAWDGDEGGFELAQSFLGMNEESAHELFEPWHFFNGYDDGFNSAARGAAVIRHFLATGEVDWDRFDDLGTVVETQEEE